MGAHEMGEHEQVQQDSTADATAEAEQAHDAAETSQDDQPAAAPEQPEA